MSKKPKPFFKRIQIDRALISKKVRFRVARTTLPKPAASWHPLRGFSLNSSHGARVSKTFHGMTLGFQNTNFVFKGRWSSSLFGSNLNLSKSGFSFSQTNFLGTYNFSNPNRSSANILGIQFRGKKAIPWALFGFWVSLPLHLIKLLFSIIKVSLPIIEILVRFVFWFAQLLWLLGVLMIFSTWYLIIALVCIIVPDHWIKGN